jgi:septal ring factor EnvC (AmiA/AmiB activator)
MRWRGWLVVVLLTATGAAEAQQGPSVVRQIRENQQRLDSIRREREGLEGELQQLRSRMSTLSSELDNIERQKTITARIVNELDRQTLGMRSQVDTVTLQLLVATDALAESQAVLRGRLVGIYKRGPLYAFQVLLAAESFGDLLSRYKYLYLVSRQDRALVQEVVDLRDRIGSNRRQLVSIERTIESQRDQRSRELRRYESLERSSSRALQQAQATQRQTSSRIANLSAAEEELVGLLAALERARRAALARGDLRVPEASITGADLGQLDWPVDGGRVVYSFGSARGPDGTEIIYQGIGIGVPVGTAVTAVADGLVEIASPLNTYGPSVLLNHGGGVYTLYSYLSTIAVTPGQLVSVGQTLGQSGGESSDHGPHIEFQLRQASGESNNPIALDPENWLRRRR